MCGLAGFIEPLNNSFPENISPEQRLERMLEMIKHRGPDDWGMCFLGYDKYNADPDHITQFPDKGPRVALGHRRLSILDLSPAGQQPMVSRDGNIIVLLNGEIYNYIELREELSAHTEFFTESDTEVLIEAYLHWGVDVFKRLDGIFAIALWDRRENKLICVRDPMNVKPFYYATENGRFYFGSEPRAVLAGMGTTGHIDPIQISEFLIMSMSDQDERTFYTEVKQIKGGDWISVSEEGQVSDSVTFWNPPENSNLNGSHVPELLHDTINTAVMRQLRSDVQVGSALSGGLDSGAIVMTAGRILGSDSNNYKTFTLSNPGFEDDESDMARLTSEKAGMNWIPVLQSMDNITSDFERMVIAMGEPFSSLSMFAQFKVMEMAKQQDIKVMLDGQGGDEAFLGYPVMAQRIVTEHLRHARVDRAIKEWIGLHKNSSLPLMYPIYGNLYFGFPKFALWRGKHRIKDIVSTNLLEQLRMDVARDFYNVSSLRKVQIGELTKYGLPRLLRYEDRNSMAFGIEARVPLLSVDVVNLALQLSPRWQVRDGWTKYALRMAMNDVLPPEIVWNKVKRGFNVPDKNWSSNLFSTIKVWLNDLPADSPIDTKKLISLIDSDQGSSHWVWRVISVALWMRFSNVKV